MANRLRLTFLAFVLIALAAASAAAELAIVDIVKQIRPAVVTVTTYNSAGTKQSQGSGFFVDASHVITDWHVVKGADKVEVKSSDGKIHAVNEISGGDGRCDLARLGLVAPNNSVKPLTVIAAVPEPGERVIVVGSPYGLEASVSDGIVSEVRDLPSLGRVIQISAPISRGSSGSPVVNLKGEVVGVAQAIHGDGQNINFAIPGAQVLAMRSGTGTPLPSRPGGVAAGPSTDPADNFERGYALFRAKDYDAALPYLLETVRKSPRHYFAWFAAGHCYVQTGRYAEAADAFASSVKIKSDFLEGYCSLGAALGLMGRHSQAVEVFKIAIRLQPESAIAHYGLALEYIGTGDTDSAMQEHRLLQKLDPSLAARLLKIME